MASNARPAAAPPIKTPEQDSVLSQAAQQVEEPADPGASEPEAPPVASAPEPPPAAASFVSEPSQSPSPIEPTVGGLLGLQEIIKCPVRGAAAEALAFAVNTGLCHPDVPRFIGDLEPDDVDDLVDKFARSQSARVKPSARDWLNQITRKAFAALAASI